MSEYKPGPDLGPHLGTAAEKLFDLWSISPKGTVFITDRDQEAGLWFAQRVNAEGDLLSIVMVPEDGFPRLEADLEAEINEAQFFFGGLAKTAYERSRDPTDALIRAATYLCFGREQNGGRLEFLAHKAPQVIPVPRDPEYGWVMPRVEELVSTIPRATASAIRAVTRLRS